MFGSARISLTTLCLCFWLGLAGAPFAAQDDARAPTAGEPTKPASPAQTRMVVGAARGETLRAAIEIKMKPQAHTYWRNPGEAGVPPTFDFTKSENIADAIVALPAPARLSEAGGQALGYKEQVAFFVSAKKKDPGKPARLALLMDFAVCDRLCMPARAELSAEMDAKPSEMDAKLVDDAEEDAPKKRMAEGVKFAPVTPSDKPTWSIETEPADAIIENPVRDVFVEAPEGYYVETSKGEKRGFKLVFAETPKDGAPQKQMLRFTLVRRLGQAEEFSARLDGAP